MATVHLGGCQKVKTDIAAVRLERAHLITEKALASKAPKQFLTLAHGLGLGA